MSNKITNDELFENYVGKYIALEQNGVKKKYYVSEINKSSFLTNVSILRGVSGTATTDFSFTSAGVPQKCDTCDFPCISAIPVIELLIAGKRFAGNIGYDSSFLSLPYLNENHQFIINGYNAGTISLSTLSADFNIVWIVPTNRTDIKTTTDDVFAPYIQQLQSIGQATGVPVTSSYKVIFFPPSYYYYGGGFDQGFNTFTIKPTFAFNPTIGSQYDSSLFWASYYSDAIGFETSKILYKKLVQNSTGNVYLSCYPWIQYDIEVQDMVDGGPPAGMAWPPFYSPTIYPPSTEFQQITCVFMDLNPCVVPNNLEIYSYDPTKYYTDFNTVEKHAYEYFDHNINPPVPFLRKYDFYSGCYGPLTSVYYGYNTTNRADNWPGNFYYADYKAATLYNGQLVFDEAFGGPRFSTTIVDGLQTGSTLC